MAVAQSYLEAINNPKHHVQDTAKILNLAAKIHGLNGNTKAAEQDERELRKLHSTLFDAAPFRTKVSK